MPEAEMDKVQVRCNICGLVKTISLPIEYMEWLLLERHLSRHGKEMDARFESLMSDDAKTTWEVAMLERLWELKDDRE